MSIINLYNMYLNIAQRKMIKKQVQEDSSYPASNPKHMKSNVSQLRLWGKGVKTVRFTLGLTVSSC